MRKVSILITSYNAEKTIANSLKSSLNQNFEDYEIIVVDDGSSDKTSEILKKFKNKKIKKYFLNENIGRTKALNYGLKKCNSKYIAILDADDISHPDRLKIQFNFLEKKNCFDLVCSFYNKKFDYKKKEIIKFKNLELFKEKLKYINLIAHSSVMYRASQIKKLKIYNNNFLYAQDYEMILKFLKKDKIGLISKILTTVNICNENMTNSLKYKKIVIFERVRLLYFSLKNFKFKFFKIGYTWITIIYLMIKYYLI
jgi:glycosyltransferase involved in cell wall biosynthesis